MNIVITESQDYNPLALNIYRSIGTVECIQNNHSNIRKKLENAEVVVIRLGVFFNKEILDCAPNIKYIITPTTGTNHIDLDETDKRAIKVLSLRGEVKFLNTIPSTAEHTWALLLALYRNIIPAVKHTSEGGWDRDLFKGNNLLSKTIGIIGMGRVGKQVSNFANAFGMNVCFYEPFQSNTPNYAKEFKDIKELFKVSDIISIHIPLTKENTGFIGIELISSMKKNAVIINTSRGEVWDENAIIAAIKNKHISGVATDVLCNEFDPLAIDKNGLIELQRKGYPVIVTPHIGGATFDSMHSTELFMAKKFLKTIKNVWD